MRARFDLFGIVEGFYGLIWTHEDRLDMLRFMGRVGMTSYIYAPKEDPHLRGHWRDPYPKDQLTQFKELLEAAGEHGIDFHYALSPGARIAYSDAADYEALLGKIAHMSDVGVKRFALFFDDMPTWLEAEADRSRFGDLASAHIDLINRLHGHLADKGHRRLGGSRLLGAAGGGGQRGDSFLLDRRRRRRAGDHCGAGPRVAASHWSVSHRVGQFPRERLCSLAAVLRSRA
jgi:hypothetical protein